MMSRVALCLLTAAILVAVAPLRPQEKKPGSGVGGSFGLVSTISDVDDYQDHPMGRAFGRMYLSESFALEGGLGMGLLEGENGGKFFSSLSYTVDVRAHLQLMNKVKFRPFLFGGLGILVFDPEDQKGKPLPRNAAGEYGHVTTFVPIGAGGEYYLNDQYAFGLNGSYNFTMSDNLDDIELEGNDAFWTVGIHVFAFLTDQNDDPDGDKLLNDEERKIGTNPMNPDTDGDGLKDGEEVKTYLTDPLNPDTDGDRLKDGEEVFKYKTDPLNPDTDGDGLDDGYEALTIYSSNTGPDDFFWGGLRSPGIQRLLDLSRPNGAATAYPGLLLASLGGTPRAARTQDPVGGTTTDPLKPDTDGDGLTDGEEVLTLRTHPLKQDTDGDGLADGDEVRTRQTDPLKPDTDADELTDGDEVLRHRTNPLVADTDGGGVPDGREIQINLNPLDASDDVPIIKVGERIILEGVNFETNKATLLPGAKEILDQVASSLIGNTEAEVAIHGHTDNVGGAKYNQDLSLRRAESVKAYLVSLGIPAARMSTRGYGFVKPIADNSSAQGRAKNRRIEFVRIK